MSDTIPGDEGYGREVIVPQVQALGERINAAFAGLDLQDASIDKLIKVIDALDLGDDEAVNEALSEIMLPYVTLIQRASDVVNRLMDRAGLNVEAVTPPQTNSALVDLLPPELRELSAEESSGLLGDRVYGLGLDELKNKRDLIHGATLVAVSEDGKTLSVVGSKNQVTGLTGMNNRCINMYNRFLISGTDEIRSSDTEPFKPYGGTSVSLAKIIASIHLMLDTKLGIDDLIFTNNGELTSKTRYYPTGKVVFVAQEVIDASFGDTAP